MQALAPYLGWAWSPFEAEVEKTEIRRDKGVLSIFLRAPGVFPAFQNTGLCDNRQEKEPGWLSAPRRAGAAGRGAQGGGQRARRDDDSAGEAGAAPACLMAQTHCGVLKGEATNTGENGGPAGGAPSPLTEGLQGHHSSALSD